MQSADLPFLIFFMLMILLHFRIKNEDNKNEEQRKREAEVNAYKMRPQSLTMDRALMNNDQLSTQKVQRVQPLVARVESTVRNINLNFALNPIGTKLLAPPPPPPLAEQSLEQQTQDLIANAQTLPMTFHKLRDSNDQMQLEEKFRTPNFKESKQQMQEEFSANKAQPYSERREQQTLKRSASHLEEEQENSNSARAEKIAISNFQPSQYNVLPTRLPPTTKKSKPNNIYDVIEEEQAQKNEQLYSKAQLRQNSKAQSKKSDKFKRLVQQHELESFQEDEVGTEDADNELTVIAQTTDNKLVRNNSTNFQKSQIGQQNLVPMSLSRRQSEIDTRKSDKFIDQSQRHTPRVLDIASKAQNVESLRQQKLLLEQSNKYLENEDNGAYGKLQRLNSHRQQSEVDDAQKLKNAFPRKSLKEIFASRVGTYFHHRSVLSTPIPDNIAMDSESQDKIITDNQISFTEDYKKSFVPPARIPPNTALLSNLSQTVKTTTATIIPKIEQKEVQQQQQTVKSSAPIGLLVQQTETIKPIPAPSQSLDAKQISAAAGQQHNPDESSSKNKIDQKQGQILDQSIKSQPQTQTDQQRQVLLPTQNLFAQTVNTRDHQENGQSISNQAPTFNTLQRTPTGGLFAQQPRDESKTQAAVEPQAPTINTLQRTPTGGLFAQQPRDESKTQANVEPQAPTRPYIVDNFIIPKNDQQGQISAPKDTLSKQAENPASGIRENFQPANSIAGQFTRQAPEKAQASVTNGVNQQQNGSVDQIQPKSVSQNENGLAAPLANSNQQQFGLFGNMNFDLSKPGSIQSGANTTPSNAAGKINYSNGANNGAPIVLGTGVFSLLPGGLTMNQGVTQMGAGLTSSFQVNGSASSGSNSTGSNSLFKNNYQMNAGLGNAGAPSLFGNKQNSNSAGLSNSLFPAGKEVNQLTNSKPVTDQSQSFNDLLLKNSAPNSSNNNAIIQTKSKTDVSLIGANLGDGQPLLAQQTDWKSSTHQSGSNQATDNKNSNLNLTQNKEEQLPLNSTNNSFSLKPIALTNTGVFYNPMSNLQQNSSTSLFGGSSFLGTTINERKQ